MFVQHYPTMCIYCTTATVVHPAVEESTEHDPNPNSATRDPAAGKTPFPQPNQDTLPAPATSQESLESPPASNEETTGTGRVAPTYMHFEVLYAFLTFHLFLYFMPCFWVLYPPSPFSWSTSCPLCLACLSHWGKWQLNPPYLWGCSSRNDYGCNFLSESKPDNGLIGKSNLLSV